MMNVYMGADVEDFIFGESTTYGYDEVDNVTDEEMNAEGVIECVDDPDVACYRIALENEQNYNAIMTAMMEREIGVLESTGSEIVYEAGKVKEFFGWIKKQIQKFWAKVKGVFKKVMDTITSFVLSNKAFVKKYRPVASQMKKPKNKKDFEGYEFGDLAIKYDRVADHLKVKKSEIKGYMRNSDNIAIAKDRQDRRGAIDASNSLVRGIICGEGSVAADAFDEKLRMKLYGGLKAKKLSIKSFSEYLNALETAADVKKDAKEGYKEAEKSIKKLLSTVKEAESELGEKAKEDGMKVARMLSDCINGALSIMSTALSYQTRAIVAKAQQDRKIANWYVIGQSVKESAMDIDGELAINLI